MESIHWYEEDNNSSEFAFNHLRIKEDIFIVNRKNHHFSPKEPPKVIILTTETPQDDKNLFTFPL